MSESDATHLPEGVALLFWRAQLHLCWMQGVLYWVAETADEALVVDHQTYHRIFKEELAKQGMEWKTWTEYMRPAEKAWDRQCAIENTLRCNFDFWKQVPGVQIRRLHQDDHKE